MCGISGWFCQGEARPSPEILKGLLLANMERGVSATGVAYQDGEAIRIKKAKGPADEFIKASGDLLEKAAQSPRGLLHARATTKGSEEQNVNNHPVAGFNWAVVHNGTIQNDEDVWAYYEKRDKLKRFAEVDTSAIPLVMSRGKSIEESINNLSILGGSLTIAAWHSKDIERMILGRFGYNDLFMFYDQGDEIMYWSSASSASFVMRGSVFGRHKFLSFSRLADEHVLVLQPGGFAATRVFKVDRRAFTGPYVPKSHSTTMGGGSTTHGAQGTLPVPFKSAVQSALVLSTAKTGITRITPGRIDLVLVPPDGVRQMQISWNPMEVVTGKPDPMSTHFNRVWWTLGSKHADFILAQKEDTEFFTGYGRWVYQKTTDYGTWPDGVQRSWRPYKRTKDWMARQYRTKWQLPFVQVKGETDLDDQFAWEHYDVQTVLLSNESRRYLGFMCPVCGVWTSSPQVQLAKERCAFCGIRHRLYPVLR